MAKITRIDKLKNNFYLGTKAIRHGKEVLENVLDKKDVYSFEETLTDKVWVNNKPIYRKVVDCGNMPTDSVNKSVAHNISNIDEVITCIGRATNGTSTFNFPYAGTRNAYANAIFQIRCFSDHVDIGNSSSSYSEYKVYAILEYTKK